MNTSSKKNICDCGGVMKSEKITRDVPIGKQYVLLENVDAKVCQKCGEIYLDGKMILDIESEIEKKFYKESRLTYSSLTFVSLQQNSY